MFLILSLLIVIEDAGYATEFIGDLKDRLANRVQLTIDGHRAYLDAVWDAFGADVDLCPIGEVVRRTERPRAREKI